MYAYANDVDHTKFDRFLYYRALAKYHDEQFALYLNVGRGFNDKKYHLYDITKQIRDTADRINGLERPKPNEGYALTNGISNKSIPLETDLSTVSTKKVENGKASRELDTDYLSAAERGDMETAQRMVEIMKPYENILPTDKEGKTLVKNGSYDISVEIQRFVLEHFN